MEAPEKIFLEWYRIGDEKYREWCTIPKTNDEPVEYTRTDTFIEKACRFIKEHHHEFSFWNTEEYELGFSTEKFIEEFKKYMES